jgi:hypothetical protein
MKATIRRSPSTDAGTFGSLTFGTSVVQSLELPWRENRRQRSCIPVGVYDCVLVRSPRFGLVYEVKDVPGRSHVLIHRANLGGDVDKGLDTELHGCIAPFTRMGVMRNSRGAMQPAGLVSSTAFRLFMEWAGGKPFTLEIENA